MERTGTANLPLHGGKAPRWLFKRMVALSEGILDVMVHEFGPKEVLQRISDPFWFQALTCVLGFDWHSSGTTTVTCGALKEAIKPHEHGLAIAGGKGRASQVTPLEIQTIGSGYNLSNNCIEDMKYSSRLTAKVDNAAIQDGYDLYHHNFLFSEDGAWAVIQQGINADAGFARRYHWASEDIYCFVKHPHEAIMGRQAKMPVLDMTARSSGGSRDIAIDLVNDGPSHLLRDWNRLRLPRGQATLEDWSSPKKGLIHDVPELSMPRTIDWRKMKEIYEFQPKGYEQLLSMQGVGPGTVRALALIAEFIYGEPPSWSDPVKYSFTVGGKDGVPFPVDCRAMDESIEMIKQGIQQAKLGERQRLDAIKRLKTIVPPCRDQ